MIRIYLDLEYCYPEMTKESGRPTDKDLRQVIQIAAIKYDTDKDIEVGAFDVLVKPIYTKILPSFFVELTGITQEQVDEDGLVFREAMERFTAFCGDIPIYTFDQDWYVLRQNYGYYNLTYIFNKQPFKRIKPRLKAWGIDANKYSSGTLYKAAGLDMQGKVHNALHDVRSMATATSYFESNSSD